MKHVIEYSIVPRSLSCSIEITEHLLKNSRDFAYQLKKLASRFAVITDENVKKIYGDFLLETLKNEGIEASLFAFPSGERSKNRRTKEKLEDQMFQEKFGKDTCIIAFGGGVVSDVAGYLAATYCRGVPLIVIPTSLLGMVDASIGGKTGVDVSYGKNLIGCIYHPHKIIIDPRFLETLPREEFQNGLSEMIKHGLILDSAYFSFLEKQREKLLDLHLPALTEAIFKSIQIKTDLVAKESQGSPIRDLLNFGHTVGHALEKNLDFLLPHGKAVAIGMVVESYLSVQMGILPQSSLEKIMQVLFHFGHQFRLPKTLSIQNMLDTMGLDKKSIKGQPRFVILKEIGQSLSKKEYCFSVENSLLKKALNWMVYDLCCD